MRLFSKKNDHKSGIASELERLGTLISEAINGSFRKIQDENNLLVNDVKRLEAQVKELSDRNHTLEHDNIHRVQEAEVLKERLLQYEPEPIPNGVKEDIQIFYSNVYVTSLGELSYDNRLYDTEEQARRRQDFPDRTFVKKIVLKIPIDRPNQYILVKEPTK